MLDMASNDDNGLPCADKAAFYSQKEALAAATLAKHRHGGKLKTYKCKYCDLWHLASDYDD